MLDSRLPFSKFGTAPHSPPDDRDHTIDRYLTGPTPLLPDEIGYRSWLAYPGIRDQGWEGACTGFDFRGVKGTMERLAKSKAGRGVKTMSRVPDFGPRGIYHLAKQVGGYPNGEGAYLRDVLKAAQQYGSPRESDWPYVANTGPDGPHDIGQPDGDFYRNAQHWKIGAYARLNTLEEMLRCLHEIGPIFAAITVYTSFFDTGSDGVVPPISGKEEGGHALCFAAASQSRRAFLVPNSWGPSWGWNGWCWIPFDYYFQVDGEAWSIPDHVAA